MLVSAAVNAMYRQALIGMTSGAGLMVFFGVAWVFLGIYTGRTLPASLRIAVFLIGIAFAVWTGLAVKRVTQLPTKTPSSLTADRQIGRRFGWISGLEGGAIGVAVVLLNVMHRQYAIVPTIAIIVGLHFFPLASLFGRSLYYATGALACAVGIAGFIISDPPLRNSVVGLGLGLLLWTTAAIVLVEIWRLSGMN